MSINDTSPSELFGGTWEQIKDKFLLACGDSYELLSEGGETEHILTIDEMPPHDHNFNYNAYGASGTSEFVPTAYNPTISNDFINSTGGGQPHNNMPPYIAVKIWKRIADVVE